MARKIDSKVLANEAATNEVRLLVLKFFGNTARTDLWMELGNPALLGGLKPNQLCRLGRAAYLLKVVKQALEENEPA